MQLLLKGVKVFLHLEISKKLISKAVASSLMPPEGLEGVICMGFLQTVVRLTLNAELLLLYLCIRGCGKCQR